MKRLSSCPISWKPNVLEPVFYGVRDYGVEEGAPIPCQVFFPSIDGSPQSAPILDGCGQYPLILFAHGSCHLESQHYKKWISLAGRLARGGYIVVVPHLQNISEGSPPWGEHNDMNGMKSLSIWIREKWEYRHCILPEPETGIIGHSYGALLAARFATTVDIKAYASISGDWHFWEPFLQEPIRHLTIPMFFTWGTGELFQGLQPGTWEALTTPKHKLVFDESGHWDYLPPGSTSCEGVRGPCTHIGALTSDFALMFFGKYLRQKIWFRTKWYFRPFYWILKLFRTPWLRIPSSLIPPSLRLSEEQQRFAGNYLNSMSLIQECPECSMTSSWELGSGSTGTVKKP